MCCASDLHPSPHPPCVYMRHERTFCWIRPEGPSSPTSCFPQCPRPASGKPTGRSERHISLAIAPLQLVFWGMHLLNLEVAQQPLINLSPMTSSIPFWNLPNWWPSLHPVATHSKNYAQCEELHLFVHAKTPSPSVLLDVLISWQREENFCNLSIPYCHGLSVSTLTRSSPYLPWHSFLISQLWNIMINFHCFCLMPLSWKMSQGAYEWEWGHPNEFSSASLCPSFRNWNPCWRMTCWSIRNGLKFI